MGEWGDPNKEIDGWEIVDNPERGDIAAFKQNYSNASGHVGVYLGNGQGIWANDMIIRKYMLNNSKTSWNTDKKIIYRRLVKVPNSNSNISERPKNSSNPMFIIPGLGPGIRY